MGSQIPKQFLEIKNVPILIYTLYQFESVEEIDKLTNRVKELEDELSKVKLNPINVDKLKIEYED